MWHSRTLHAWLDVYEAQRVFDDRHVKHMLARGASGVSEARQIPDVDRK